MRPRDKEGVVMITRARFGADGRRRSFVEIKFANTALLLT